MAWTLLLLGLLAYCTGAAPRVSRTYPAPGIWVQCGLDSAQEGPACGGQDGHDPAVGSAAGGAKMSPHSAQTREGVRAAPARRE